MCNHKTFFIRAICHWQSEVTISTVTLFRPSLFLFHSNFGGSDGRESLQCTGPEFSPWVGKIPWGRAWQPTPVFSPRESPWTEEPCGLQSMGSQSWTQLSHSAQHTQLCQQLDDLYGICQLREGHHPDVPDWFFYFEINWWLLKS